MSDPLAWIALAGMWSLAIMSILAYVVYAP
jgi:hypothetical protein